MTGADDDPVPPAVRERYDTVEVRRQLHDVPPNEVYLLAVDGQRAVLKRSTDPRGDAGVEGRAQRLAGEAEVAVPEVLWVGDGAFLAAYDDAVPDPADAGATPEWCRAAGRGLARLHSVTFDRHGPLRVDGDPADPASGLRVADAGDGTWPDAALDLLDVFGEAVAGTEYAAVAEETAAFIDEHRGRLAGVEPVLVHGWFTPEHVAAGDGEVRTVVDFEHATSGAAEYDLWRLAIPTFGVGEGVPDDSTGWRRFREAYESVRPLPEDLAERADAYRALVGVSYLDSLATQRGLAGNEERAASTVEYVRERLATARERWA